ncbi:hypothetical protein NGRA_0494 [Nosema granulosis]|uniref:Uncharacterized protein n=1 Tax=Nosema granulosis TaxID=83296 RepID=A0A9P6H095_9MICR|nr:hypothetical protein NGRA_0494 [Nosema granulosis]
MYFDDVKKLQNVTFRVLDKKVVDANSSELVYYGPELDKILIRPDNLAIIRYHFRYPNNRMAHTCQTLIDFDFKKSIGLRLTKNNRDYTYPELKTYFEMSVLNAIAHTASLDKTQLNSSNFDRVFKSKRPFSKYFNDKKTAKKFILMLKNEFKSIEKKYNGKVVDKILKKLQYYYSSLYKKKWTLSRIFLKEILNDSVKEHQMMLTICDMVNELILIIGCLRNEEVTKQTNLNIEQSKAVFKIENCFVLHISGMDELSKQDVCLVLNTKDNTRTGVADIYIDLSNRIVIPLGDIKQENIDNFEISIKLPNSSNPFEKIIKIA